MVGEIEPWRDSEKPTVLRKKAPSRCSRREGHLLKQDGESQQKGPAVETDPEQREEVATAGIAVEKGALVATARLSQCCSLRASLV